MQPQQTRKRREERRTGNPNTNATAMASSYYSSLPLAKVTLVFICATSILLLLPWTADANVVANANSNSTLENHHGAVVSGNLDISILWYGRFARLQKRVLRQFIQSLNDNTIVDPKVASWWNIVEQYQAVSDPPPIKVRIVKEQPDNRYSAGKKLTQQSILSLVNKATSGLDGATALVFTDKGVSVEGTCNKGRCSHHGFVEKTLYMVVSDPETQCPDECGWPFQKPPSGRQTIILPLQPPSGNVATDSMLIGLAGALAQMVSDPYNTGFYGGQQSDPIEVVSACPNIFGSGAFPGYMGKVRIVPGSGACYNARGVEGSRFLLPALWNPKTKSCWTII